MNYEIFDKHLNRITDATKAQFCDKATEVSYLIPFLKAISTSGNAVSAINKVDGLSISPLDLGKIMGKDRAFKKCVDMAEKLAFELAENTLFDRAINGYEEMNFDKEGRCTVVKKKYCLKSLLEYLKANSEKYRNVNLKARSGSGERNEEEDSEDAAEVRYEIKSFAPAES